MISHAGQKKNFEGFLEGTYKNLIKNRCYRVSMCSSRSSVCLPQFHVLNFPKPLGHVSRLFPYASEDFSLTVSECTPFGLGDYLQENNTRLKLAFNSNL